MSTSRRATRSYCSVLASRHAASSSREGASTQRLRLLARRTQHRLRPPRAHRPRRGRGSDPRAQPQTAGPERLRLSVPLGAAGLIVTEIPNGQPQTVGLRHSDGTVTRLFHAHQGMPYLEPVDVSPDGSTILYESLVTCQPPQPTSGEVAWACLATGDLIETGSIDGGTPGQPASISPSPAQRTSPPTAP